MITVYFIYFIVGIITMLLMDKFVDNQIRRKDIVYAILFGATVWLLLVAAHWAFELADLIQSSKWKEWWNKKIL